MVDVFLSYSRNREINVVYELYKAATTVGKSTGLQTTRTTELCHDLGIVSCSTISQSLQCRRGVVVLIADTVLHRIRQRVSLFARLGAELCPARAMLL